MSTPAIDFARRLTVTHDPSVDALTVKLHYAGPDQPRVAGSFTDPLTPKDRAELRWYLEEYLKFPVGISPGRARKVEAAMQEWGERMFTLLFGPGRPARDIYQLAKDEGLRHFDFEIHYEAAYIGIIPWELLYDPELGSYLVHQFASFSRFRGGAPVELLEPRQAEEKLNVLVVISRPYGKNDVPYRTVVRPIMEVLQAPHLQRRIRVEILRPPTFENLKAHLTRRRAGSDQAFFDVLHFDGHGGLEPKEVKPGEPLRVFDVFAGPPGSLLFETDDGKEAPLAVEELRRWLGQHQVPLVVLNACRSGMETLDEPGMQTVLALQAKLRHQAPDEVKAELAEQNRRIASVASTLLNAGAHGVVAMGYIVRAKAAAVFMRAFYHRLLEGGSAAEAITSGRLAMHGHPERPTSFGDVPLQDWMIPIYHERMRLRLFRPPNRGEDPERTLKASLKEQQLRSPAEESAAQLPKEPRHGFVGRDLELLEIERGLRRQGSAGVAITGLGGNGKTTLAVGAARWLHLTHAPQVAGGIYFHAFVDRNEQDQAVHPALPWLIRNAGCQHFGPKFERLRDQEQQRQVLTTHLRQAPCLLILDNVEAAAGLGELPALLSERERREFREFLRQVCPPQGNTRLLITSRREEGWLALPLAPVPLGGLDPEATGELANKVLATAISSIDLQERLSDAGWTRAYNQLLDALHGHPLALQLILPQLRHRRPEHVLVAFEAGDASLDSELTGMEYERERTLASCLNYSFSALPAAVQRLMEVLAFFRETVDTDVLAYMAQEGEGFAVPERLRDLTSQNWQNILRQAAQTGLVNQLDEHPALFRLHALLPWFLANRLRRAPDRSDLETAFRYTMAGMAQAIFEGYEGDGKTEASVRAFRRHQPTLLHALALARKAREPDVVFALAHCLYRFLAIIGQTSQARELRAELTAEWQPTGDPRFTSPEGEFWLHLEINRANELLDAGDPLAAEQIYAALAESLGEDAESDAAVVFHGLGTVAEEQRQFEQAEHWFQKSLEICLRLRDEMQAAKACHHLGLVAEEQRQFEQARNWHEKSLEISLRFNNEAGAASSYHQLGRVAQEQTQFEEAQDFFKKSFEISNRLGNESWAASSYLHLGIIAQEQKDFEQAQYWYEKSLEVDLRLGKGREAANAYHLLGTMAQEQGHCEQAQLWYSKSLEANEPTGNTHGMALTYGALGNVAASLGHGAEAALHEIKALKLLHSKNDSYNSGILATNLYTYICNDLVTPEIVAALWQAEIGSPLPEDLAHALASPPEVPEALRLAFAELLAAGMTFEEGLAMVKAETGETMNRAFVRRLRELLERSTPAGEKSP